MRNKIIVFTFLQLLALFTISHACAWDNPNKTQVNTGVYALKTAMIGAYMNGFNEEYTDGDNKDFLKYYEEGYYKGRVFRNQKM